jgi:hypothetical protein
MKHLGSSWNLESRFFTIGIFFRLKIWKNQDFLPLVIFQIENLGKPRFFTIGLFPIENFGKPRFFTNGNFFQIEKSPHIFQTKFLTASIGKYLHVFFASLFLKQKDNEFFKVSINGFCNILKIRTFAFLKNSCFSPWKLKSPDTFFCSNRRDEQKV